MKTWSLVWHGRLTLWQGLLLAAILAGLAIWLYRREIDRRMLIQRRLLPILRALVVVLLVLMLTGATLHFRQVLGQKARVLVFVDGSQSMGLCDAQMESGRKLRVLDQMGLLPPNILDGELVAADRALASVCRQLDSALAAPPGDVDLAHIAGDVTTQIDTALTHLKSAQANKLVGPGAAPVSLSALVERFRAELVTAGTAPLAAAGAGNLRSRLTGLDQTASRWQHDLETDLDAYADHVLADPTGPTAGAVAKFDQMPRLRRVEALLLGGSNPLLAQLGRQADVELVALVNSQARVIWSNKPEAPLPATLGIDPSGSSTDLADPVRAQLVEGQRQEQEQLALILSDGQNNAPTYPKQMAAELRGRVPLYTITMGSTFLPKDLAIFKVDGPQSVFHKDRLKGRITLKDDMPPGTPFTVKIQYGERTVWSQQLTTERSHMRTVDYDFPIEDLASDYLLKHPVEQAARSIIMDFRVALAGVEGFHLKGRQSADLLVPVVQRKRRILLIDGRPRWEFRYLRNAFERDQEWDTDSLVASVAPPGQGWVRDDRPANFPRGKDALSGFDVIVFGDLPPGLFTTGDLAAIKDFVVTRGGGLIFIDGARGHLRRYSGTPLEELLPVDWKVHGLVSTGAIEHLDSSGGSGASGGTWNWLVSSAAMGRPSRLQLTEAGTDFAPLALVPDAHKNAELWQSFQPPHWVAVTHPLPGSQVLMEAVYSGGNLPVMVTRRVGDGNVLYLADDESWRLRYLVADQYHPRYWKQLADWIAQPPSAGRDRYVSIEEMGALFNSHDQVPLRVRIRDAQGRPWNDASAEAVLTRDGEAGPVVPLDPQPGNPGLYLGTCPALAPGRYEVSVRIHGLPDDQMKARAQFTVQALQTGEMAALNADAATMQAIAVNSGGRAFREDDASDLVAHLPNTDHSIVKESDMPLWSSWYWFAAVLTLLALEWLIRKRSGLM